MTEIMPVPRKLRITVLPAGGSPCLFYAEMIPSVSLAAARAESQASATQEEEKTSSGVLQPRHFLGRELIWRTTASSSSCVTLWKSQPLGK